MLLKAWLMRAGGLWKMQRAKANLPWGQCSVSPEATKELDLSWKCNGDAINPARKGAPEDKQTW